MKDTPVEPAQIGTASSRSDSPRPRAEAISARCGSSGPNSAVHEWVRWVNTGCCQGDAQESLHPNAFGQRALGKCVELMYAKTSGNWSCRNTPGSGYTAMTLVSIT